MAPRINFEHLRRKNSTNHELGMQKPYLASLVTMISNYWTNWYCRVNCSTGSA